MDEEPDHSINSGEMEESQNKSNSPNKLTPDNGSNDELGEGDRSRLQKRSSEEVEGEDDHNNAKKKIRNNEDNDDEYTFQNSSLENGNGPSSSRQHAITDAIQIPEGVGNVEEIVDDIQEREGVGNGEEIVGVIQERQGVGNEEEIVGFIQEREGVGNGEEIERQIRYADIEELLQSQTGEENRYTTRHCLTSQYHGAEGLSPENERVLHNSFFVLLKKWRVRELATEPEVYITEQHKQIDLILLGLGDMRSELVCHLLQTHSLEKVVGFHVTALLLIDWLRLASFDACVALYNLCIENNIDTEYTALVKYCFGSKFWQRRRFWMGGVNLDVLPDGLHAVCTNPTYNDRYLANKIKDTVMQAKSFFISDHGTSETTSLLSPNVNSDERKSFFDEMCSVIIFYFFQPCVSIGEMILKCDRSLLTECDESVFITVFNGDFEKKIFLHKSVIERANDGSYEGIVTDRLVVKPEDLDTFLTYLYFRHYKLDLMASASLGLYSLMAAVNIKGIWDIFNFRGDNLILYKGRNLIDVIIIAIKTCYVKQTIHFHDAIVALKSIISPEIKNYFLNSLTADEIIAVFRYIFFDYVDEYEKYRMLLKWAFLEANIPKISWDTWSVPPFSLEVKGQFDRVKHALNYRELAKFQKKVESHRYFYFTR